VQFFNLKSPEELLYKYKNLCETNDPHVFKEKIDKKHLNINEIAKKIKLGIDIAGRDDNYKKIEIDKSFPKYILNNMKYYKKWIAD